VVAFRIAIASRLIYIFVFLWNALQRPIGLLAKSLVIFRFKLRQVVVTPDKASHSVVQNACQHSGSQQVLLIVRGLITSSEGNNAVTDLAESHGVNDDFVAVIQLVPQRFAVFDINGHWLDYRLGLLRRGGGRQSRKDECGNFGLHCVPLSFESVDALPPDSRIAFLLWQSFWFSIGFWGNP